MRWNENGATKLEQPRTFLFQTENGKKYLTRDGQAGGNMTNVKLKLMFYLLNALLSADLVHSRPYSNFNSTDIVMGFSNNSFNIPVDSNSDTLIVADEEETAEETNKNSNTNMEAIVNAEQDRDEAFSRKNNKKQDKISILEIPNNEAGAFEKQLNISSPLLEEMIDSESDREETLTDILFRHDSELVDSPRFEFLIAAKINSSENGTVRDSTYSVNNIDKRNRNSTDVLRKVDYVELVEVIKPSNMNENKSAYNLANITAHNVENDLAPDTSFTDMQTLFLACFATFLPLLTVLFAMLLIRCALRRWCPSCCKKESDSSTSVSSDKQENNHQQLKSSEEGGTDGDTPPANGSIFTMTLKNNHLIVETEERNDITKNGRETKMKYSPDNDGIFVVEVQQSAAYRPNNKSLQNSPPHDPQISTNQALIHRVPEELDRKPIMEEDSERSSEKFDKQALALSSTGLSISDLSMSSIGSHNISYSYSSQIGYDQGPFGYPVYAGYDTSKDDIGDPIIHDNSQEPLIGKTPTDPDKPVVTAAIFKQDSIISNEVLKGPGYCIEGSTDGPLLSDVQAREYSLQHLQDQKEKKMENGVAIPISDRVDSVKTFTRTESLPSALEDEQEVKVMETIVEDLPPKDHSKGKRPSLPVITTDMYESVKEVIQTGSPKFEKFTNEMSPGESSFDSPPMITITEESESGKSDSTS
ncbi:uncharacterized protein LOC123872326 isoform X2 [Maniola jurtina]|uniref:uncharacterized protein LOC123872326 isoform X2 n=1 Tax=Maniola jurtina TaxID=191418 RepID=UPI001E68E6C0|nr:uncharacterized protein LOC123872326 isoform X2 [Maniola jurtina]